MRSIQKQMKVQQEIYLREFDALTRVLQYFGRLKPDSSQHWSLTGLGEMTSHIRAQNDLLISLALENLEIEPLTPVDLAVILSTLVYEPRRYMKHDLTPCSRTAKKVFKDLLYVADDLRYIQEVENIHLPITIEFDFAPLVALWANGCRWSNLFKFTEMTDGDVVRSMRQLIDLLRQLETVPFMPPEFHAKIREAIPLIDRDLIKLIY
jgi:superfamily II RNA helicase